MVACYTDRNMETEELERNKYENVRPERESNGRWKKGAVPNPFGRPKGKTMKEWAREYLTRLTDEERDAFFDGMPKDLVWRMAEGNPESKTDVTSNGEALTFGIAEVIAKKNTIANGDTHSEAK